MKKLLPLILLFLCLQSFAQDSLCTLPVTFTSLKVNVDARQVKIEWQTESEINNDHYEVEKSFNGKDFIKIATTAITPSRYYYAYDELNHPAFYRIKQLDKDNRYSYSKIMFASNKIFYPEVAPNPFKDELNVSLFVQRKSTYKVAIRSMTGQLVSVKELFLSSGNNFIKINTDSITSGTYVVSISNTEQVLLTQKIIK